MDIIKSEYTFLGAGRNGETYLMPDGKVLKICRKEKSCNEEYEVLKRASGSKYFPKVYKKTEKTMVRDYIGGEKLKPYIRKNGLSKKLALNLIGLIEEFERLGFKRLDMRGEHIYIQEDETVMVIDPAGQIVKPINYPKLLFKDLKSENSLRQFFKIIKIERPDLYEIWKNKI